MSTVEALPGLRARLTLLQRLHRVWLHITHLPAQYCEVYECKVCSSGLPKW